MKFLLCAHPSSAIYAQAQNLKAIYGQVYAVTTLKPYQLFVK